MNGILDIDSSQHLVTQTFRAWIEAPERSGLRGPAADFVLDCKRCYRLEAGVLANALPDDFEDFAELLAAVLRVNPSACAEAIEAARGCWIKYAATAGKVL